MLRITLIIVFFFCTTTSASSSSPLNPPSLLTKHLQQVQDHTNNRFRYLMNYSFSFFVIDVLSHSICFERVGGLLETIIPRNTLLPTMKTKIFTTYSDHGAAPRLSLFEGDHGNFSHSEEKNRLIGRYEIYGIPPAPRGVPQIEVKFSVDEEGILNVSARDGSDVLGRERLQVVKI